MAWNEPGRGGRDPWGGRGGGGRGGPPNLDQLLRRLRQFLGGGKSGPYGVAIIIALLVCAWMISGFYKVGAAERGLVTRFGAYEYMVHGGLHWHVPYPIGNVIKVDVDTLQSASNRAVLLTQDGDLVDVFVVAKYRISNPQAYAFHVSDPDEALRQVMRSAMRRVVGQHKLSDVLGSERNKMGARIQSLTQSALNRYGAGLTVSSVHIQDAKPPQAVQDAFADAAKARDDKSNDISKAQSYASNILPKAHGEAAKRLQEAQSYKARVVDQAKGESSRFLKMLQAYEKAPKAVREHLYLLTMDDVLSQSSKTLVDVGNSTPVIEIPPGRVLPPPSASKSSSSGSGDGQSSSSTGGNVSKEASRQVPPPVKQPSSGTSKAGDLLRSRSRETH